MISIIIPVLNEEDTIVTLLDHLSKHSSELNVKEIIIVDGGSDDETESKIRDYSNGTLLQTKFISSNKGRARQMNQGAKIAQGELLYFLHADSLPPTKFDEEIISANKEGFEAGCFRLKFDSSHPLLKFSQYFTRFNYSICRGGDQSLFITKTAFDKLGGFDETYIIYEDCEFINRIYKDYKFKIIPKNIITSSRKYRAVGTWRLQFHFFIIHFKKRMGATSTELLEYYQKHVQAK